MEYVVLWPKIWAYQKRQFCRKCTRSLKSFKNGENAENEKPQLEKTIERDLADVRQNGKNAEMSECLNAVRGLQTPSVERLYYATADIADLVEFTENAKSGEIYKPDPFYSSTLG